MSDPTTGGPSVPDLLMQLLRQQSEGFGEVRLSLSDQNKTINRIDLELALLKRDTEQLANVPARVNALESSRDLHARQLRDVETAAGKHEARLGDLETTSDKRTGWEGFGGKLLYVVGGAAFAGIAGMIFSALRQ